MFKCLLIDGPAGGSVIDVDFSHDYQYYAFNAGGVLFDYRIYNYLSSSGEKHLIGTVDNLSKSAIEKSIKKYLSLNH